MTSQPNIILILADDMGYGDFGCFSQGRCHTPTLDHLISQGLCLTQHYSASPVCAPARAGLLTGRYPHRTGAIDTLDHRGLDRIALRETTLADLLRQAGYHTGMVGKWHSGAIDPRYHPNARGFDEFIGFRGGYSDYYNGWLYYNDVVKQNQGQYLTDLFTDTAVEFIRRKRRQPFFLHVAYNAPHFPFQVPAEELGPYTSTGQYTMAVSTIYAMNRRMDRGLERILNAIKLQGIEDNTLVLFTSDNGPQLRGSGENCTDRFNCNWAGYKGVVYEGGIRVPMVIRWPAGMMAGQRHCDQMVHFTDWLPTLLAAAGANPPRDIHLDGENLLPLLRGQERQTNPRRFWQWNRYEPVLASNSAMRDGPWKLLRPEIPEAMHLPKEDGELDREYKQVGRFTDICRLPMAPRHIPTPPPPLLFNLENDPYEQHDLADSQPERVSRMMRDLETWFAAVEADRHTITD